MRIVKRKRVPTNENLVGAESDAESKSSRKSTVESVNDNHKNFMPPPPVPSETQLDARLNDISNSSSSGQQSTRNEKSQQALSHSSYYSLTPASSTTSLHDLSVDDQRDKTFTKRRSSISKPSDVVKKKRGRPPKTKPQIQKNKLIDKLSAINNQEQIIETINKSPLPRLNWANANDLWEIMREKDSRLKHDHMYLKKHSGIEGQMRAILIDWLIEISYAYRLHRETLHLSLEYMDRFLSECKQQMRVDRLQLIGMTSLFLASKVEEIYPPKLKELASHMENYSNNNEEAISQFELFMLKTLNWQISPVTSNTWLMTYLQIAAINYPNFLTETNSDNCVDLSSKEHNTHIVMPLNVYKNSTCSPCQLISARQQDFYMKNYMKAVTLLDLCLFEMDSMRFKYSMLAASAMYHMLSGQSASCAQPANKHVCDLVALCTGYAVSELDACIRWMAPYADVCKETIGEHKMTAIKQFSSVDSDDAHNIQLYYPNLDLLKEVELRKTPSKLNANMLTSSNILTPPESNRKSHQAGVD